MKNSSAHNIDAVIFDIGGVLVRIELSAILKSVSQLSKKSPFELAAIYKHQSILDFEVGKITEREFHRVLEGLLGCPFPYPQFCETWNSIFIGEIEPTVTLMHALNAQPELKVGILSNTNCLHLEWMRARLKTFDGIKHFYASNEIGHRKPNASAYHYVLDKMGVAPERAVFIDDLSENIAAAKAVGMHGIEATDAAAVRSGLASLGIFCAENPASTRII